MMTMAQASGYVMKITWQFWLDVANQRACDRLMARIHKRLKTTFANLKSDVYWKNEKLFKVTANSTLQAVNAKEAFDSILKVIRLLNNRWTINLPDDDVSWEISGSCDYAIPGLQFASFSTAIHFPDVP